MTRDFSKPVVVVSKCLGFDHCRYNGEIIPDDFVNKLAPFVEFRPVCAEVEIGLGVPRDPIRVVEAAGERQLVQPATGRDVSEAMRAFVSGFLDALGDEVDGFILKSRSPSCGLKDVKVYPAAGASKVLVTAGGFFGGPVAERFGHLAVEDEGRLKNYRIREHFMTKLFTLADFRRVRASGAMRELVAFQSRSKFLLLAYNQKEMRLLGSIVANAERKPFAEVAAAYGQHLALALAHPPRCGAAINVLMHGLGYFSTRLSAEEKGFFLETLEKYHAAKTPLSVPVNLLKSYAVRFGETYILEQTFFQPFPEPLVEITDSGKEAACLLEPEG